jgi:hypothetical protein
VRCAPALLTYQHSREWSHRCSWILLSGERCGQSGTALSSLNQLYLLGQGTPLPPAQSGLRGGLFAATGHKAARKASAVRLSYNYHW